MAVSLNGTYSYTLSLTGVPGTGKTAIFNHVRKKADTDNGCVVDSGLTDSGIDCCIYSTTIDGIRFKISLYDTGGLERYASLTSNYFHRTHAVILVYLYHKDRLDTATRLKPFIENALNYNKSPNTLVFSVWAHDNSSVDTDRPDDIPMEAKVLMEDNEIPLSMHHTVCASADDSDTRLMDALHDCILAVYKVTRPKSDSVLTPDIIKLGDSLDQSMSDSDSSSNDHKLAAAELERTAHQNKKKRKVKKCCPKS